MSTAATTSNALSYWFPHTSQHCGCHVIGHGVESGGKFFCCAHCAHVAGVKGVQDRI